jgi:PDZ domain
VLFLAGLAVVVLGILVDGALRQGRPASPVVATSRAITPRDGAPTLSVDLDKTPLSYFSDFWLQLGNRTRQRIVLVGSLKAPALVLTPSLAVTSLRIARESGLREPGGTVRKVLGADSDTGLTLLELSSPGTVFQASDPTTLHPGQLVAAVSLSPDHRVLVAPGHLTAGPLAAPSEITAAADFLDVAVTLPRSAELSAIVDLDGRLVGVCYDRRGRSRVLSAGALFRLAERLQASPLCRSIEVGEITASVREALGVKGGVVVERILQDAWAARPSIRPGDLLLEWNGKPVGSSGEFQKGYEDTPPGTAATYLARRGREAIRGSVVMPDANCLTPVEQPVTLANVGLTLERESEPGAPLEAPAWRIISVAPGRAAARAGLEPDDSIVAVDGQAFEESTKPDDIQALDRGRATTLLTVRRRERTLIVALEEQPEEADARRRR